MTVSIDPLYIHLNDVIPRGIIFNRVDMLDYKNCIIKYLIAVKSGIDVEKSVTEYLSMCAPLEDASEEAPITMYSNISYQLKDIIHVHYGKYMNLTAAEIPQQVLFNVFLSLRFLWLIIAKNAADYSGFLVPTFVVQENIKSMCDHHDYILNRWKSGRIWR